MCTEHILVLKMGLLVGIKNKWAQQEEGQRYQCAQERTRPESGQGWLELEGRPCRALTTQVHPWFLSDFSSLPGLPCTCAGVRSRKDKEEMSRSSDFSNVSSPSSQSQRPSFSNNLDVMMISRKKDSELEHD